MFRKLLCWLNGHEPFLREDMKRPYTITGPGGYRAVRTIHMGDTICRHCGAKLYVEASVIKRRK